MIDDKNQKEIAKKRLLIATDCFLPRWDGITRFLTELLPTLQESFSVTIIAPDFPGEIPKLEGITLLRFPLINFQFGDISFSNFHYLEIKKIIKEQDIIFTQTIGPIGICAILAGNSLKKPVISYIHSIEWELTTKSIGKCKYLINMMTKMLARFVYKRSNLLLMPFPELKELFIKNNIHTKSKIIFLGTDTAHFRPASNKEEIKQRLGIPKNTLVIGFVGRLAREKNIITLYRAFRIIEKKHENIKLLIVGKGIKDLEDEFKSNRNIIMAGTTDDVLPYLQAMDIYVLPSLTETTSLSTVEAMACGIPVLTTPVGYVKYYVLEKYNGMLFPFRNSLVLSLKLDQLLKSHEMREKLGKHARETAVKRFSLDRMTKAIVETLEHY